MAYQVLARKYRPQRFADVAGQEHVTRTLLNALTQGRIAHGYIFSGHRGIGKTTVARILAMALNCQRAIGSPERPSAEPCGTCDSCTEVRSGSAVDVIEIDAATNRGIDEIRELRDAARYRPARDRYKIYILDEAHQITDAAFNALLKTLEEPPDHVVFMMATTQPEDIPQTIRSRAQHFSFHAVSFDDILSELHAIAEKESIAAGEDTLALLAEAGDGSMRDALSIMDQAIASAPVEDGRPRLDAAGIRELMGTVPNTVFERLLEAVSENSSATVMEEANRLLNAGNSASQLARQFVRYLRNCLMSKVGGEGTELLQISADERSRASRTAMLFSEEDLLRFLQVMLRTFDELNYRQEQRFHLELGLLKLVHMQRLIPLEQVLSQLPQGGRPMAPAPAASSAGRTGTSSAASASVAPAAPARPASAPARPPVPAGEESRPPAAPFSPFEADSRRKRSPDSGPSGDHTGNPAPAMTQRSTVRAPALPEVNGSVPPRLDAEGAAAPAYAPAGSAAVAQLEAPPAVSLPTATATAESTTPALPLSPPPLRPEPPEPEIEGDMAPEEEQRLAAVEEEVETSGPVPALPAAAGPDLDSLRIAIAHALDEAGHNTAAALLSSGTWTLEGETVTAEVAVKKTMLSLTMNPEADRIAKRVLAHSGVARRLLVIPADGAGLATNGARGAMPAGSMEAQALENPLVKQAQALFRAEVRSVLDLRDKDSRDQR